MARTPDSGPGAAFRRRLHALPATTRRLVVAGIVVGVLAVWYGALFAVDRATGNDDVSWADPLSSMIGPLVGVALAFWLRRRALGSSGSVWEFDKAVRRRRLPDDADPAEWGPLLEKGDRFQRRAGKFAVGITLLLLIATVLVVAWGGHGWGVIVAAGLIGAVLVTVLELASRSQSARIDRLRDQLRGLEDRGPLTPGG